MLSIRCPTLLLQTLTTQSNTIVTQLGKLSLSAKQCQITNNEKEWIKKNGKELIEKAKNEKGVDLKIELTQPQLYYQNISELKEADDIIKKLFSLEYASAADFKRFEEDLIKREFRKSIIEDNSLEIQIALHTMQIKRMVNTRFTPAGNMKNKKVEFFLYRQINRRDRLMAELFYKDNARFEWLKQKLNMPDYKLKEAYEYKRQTRYEKHVAEVMADAERKRQIKLDQLRKLFDEQKVDFFKAKKEYLEKISAEIDSLSKSAPGSSSSTSTSVSSTSPQ